MTINEAMSSINGVNPKANIFLENRIGQKFLFPLEDWLRMVIISDERLVSLINRGFELFGRKVLLSIDVVDVNELIGLLLTNDFSLRICMGKISDNDVLTIKVDLGDSRYVIWLV
jgi:hypothetical protein